MVGREPVLLAEFSPAVLAGKRQRYVLTTVITPAHYFFNWIVGLKTFCFPA
jgi:hypothetical protein